LTNDFRGLHCLVLRAPDVGGQLRWFETLEDVVGDR
jgi:hypothetical protein